MDHPSYTSFLLDNQSKLDPWLKSVCAGALTCNCKQIYPVLFLTEVPVFSGMRNELLLLKGNNSAHYSEQLLLQVLLYNS